jgi:Type VI secretion system, TssN
MKRYLTKIDGGQALVYVFIIIAIAMMLTILLSNKLPKLKQEKNKYIVYVFIQALFLLIFAAILNNLKNTSVTQRFIATQCYMSVAGIVHLVLFQGKFKKFDAKKSYTGLFISIITALYLSAFVCVICGYFNEIKYVYYFSGALLFFLIPTLSYMLFETAVSVPAKLHKRWFYPLNEKYPSPQANEMRNIIIINLVFQKKINDEQIINFKVKAPKAFDFGRLFYYFINDYNTKNPSEQINYLDEKNQPFGWYFYTKPKWFGSAKYIDPDIGIDTNSIKDEATIICQRI